MYYWFTFRTLKHYWPTRLKQITKCSITFICSFLLQGGRLNQGRMPLPRVRKAFHLVGCQCNLWFDLSLIGRRFGSWYRSSFWLKSEWTSLDQTTSLSNHELIRLISRFSFHSGLSNIQSVQLLQALLLREAN